MNSHAKNSLSPSPDSHRRRVATRRRQRRRRALFEILERRDLLAVDIVEEKFMTITYEMGANTFGGTDRYDMPSGPDYVAQYRGSLARETIDIVYTSPTSGEGSGSGDGSYRGTENYRPRARDRGPFSCTFDGNVNIIDDNGSLSRSGATGNSSCISRSFYDLNATGTIDVSRSPFQVNVRWSESYDQGRGLITGRFDGKVKSISDADYDIFLIYANWTENQETTEIELKFEINGPAQPTPNRSTPITQARLFWSKSPNPKDRLGGPLADAVPIYWNQASGTAKVNGIPAPPDEATHLLVYVDPDQKIKEVEELFGNVCGLAVNSVRSVTWNTKRDTTSTVPPPRGFDVEYRVSADEPLPEGTELIYYWSSGPTLDDVISEIEREVLPAEKRASGKQIHNQPARFPIPPREATHIVVEMRRPDTLPPSPSGFECDTAPNVKALRVHLPEEIISADAIEPELTTDGRGIRAPFNSGGARDLTMSEAEVVFGVDHFNWYQEVTYPEYIELFDRRESLGVFLERPYIDPYTEYNNVGILSAYSDFANGTPPNPLDPTKYVNFEGFPIDPYEYYYHEVALAGDTKPEIFDNTSSTGIGFFDKPEIPADFYRPNSQDATHFTTELVGVSSTHEKVRLTQVSESLRSFRWSSNATYARAPGQTSGGGITLYVPGDWTGGQADAGGISDIGPPPIPAEPLALDDLSFRVPGNVTTSLDVLASLSIPAGAVYELRAIAPAAHGTTSLDDQGTANDATDDRIEYVPDAGYSGVDSFTFVLRRLDAFDFATVRVTLFVGDPVADAGGPYASFEGGSVKLTATGVPELGVAPIFQWDLDGDGIFGETGFDAEFGEETGANPMLTLNGVDGFPGSVWTIAVRVVDEEGNVAAEDTAEVAVANVLPTLLDLGGHSVMLGQSAEVSILAFDPGDPDEELTYAWDLDGDGVFGESGTSAERGDEWGASVMFHALQLEELTSDTYTALVRVTDDDGASSIVLEVPIVIDGLFTPPTDLLLSSNTVVEHQAGAIIGALTVVDADPRDSFSFQLNDARFEVTSALELRLLPDVALSYLYDEVVYLEIMVVDAGGNSLLQSFEISVIDINDAPTRVTGRTGEFVVYDDTGITPIDFDMLAYDPTDATEPLQELSYRIVELPSASIGRMLLEDGQTPVVNGTFYALEQIEGLVFEPNTVSEESTGWFRFEVIDDGGTADGGIDRIVETLSITVLPSGTIENSPPSLASLDTVYGNERELVSIQLDATDPDNDELIYDVDPLPNGAMFGVDSGFFSWLPGPDQRGTYSLTFGVTDGQERVTRTVTVIIASPWHNPRLNLDVTRDGSVGPVDALTVVNELNFLEVVDPVTRQFPNPLPDGYVVQYRFDVDDNGLLTPRDALLVINFLNGIAENEGEAEGPATSLGDFMWPSTTPAANDEGADSSDFALESALTWENAPRQADWLLLEAVDPEMLDPETLDLLATRRHRRAIRA